MRLTALPADPVEHYVTLFDSGFLPQGVALYRSLERHAGDFALWIICVDDAAFDILQRLALPQARLIRLHDVETDAIRAACADRNRAERCWTLTPFAPRFVFDADPAVQRVTYLDADMWFRKSPQPIFAEFEAAAKSVLITEHAYAPDHDLSHETGQYCVQFMTFVRDASEAVRSWWAARCLDWCYARLEDGKFGDQKYLDDWEERFSAEVHVLQRPDRLLAPWNAARFPFGTAIAYHFHNLRLLKGGRVLLWRGYDIPKVVRAAIYEPYLADLAAALAMLGEVGHCATPQARRPGPVIWLGVLVRKLARLAARLRPFQTLKLSPPPQSGMVK